MNIMSRRVKIAVNLYKRRKNMTLICYEDNPFDSKDKNVTLWFSFHYLNKSSLIKKTVWVGY